MEDKIIINEDGSIEIPPTCYWCGEKNIPVEKRSNARGIGYYGICPKCHNETAFIEVRNI